MWLLLTVLALSPTVTPAQTIPSLAPLDYYPDDVNGIGKWHIHVASTLPGWQYTLEESQDGITWAPSPGGQFYGNGQPIKYFVTDGPLKPAAGGSTPPSTGAGSWRLRGIQFYLEVQKNALGSAFRLRREATTISPGNTPLAAWDTVLANEPMPSMPVGTRTFIFQMWDDPVARIMWNTTFTVTITDGPPPAESLPTTPEQADELNVFQQVKAQLIGAITAPPWTGPPPASGPKRLIRLRRSAQDTNANGLPDWWELANNFPAFAAFNANTHDVDGDGLVTWLEYEYGTDPRKSDTDGDGLTDLEEIKASSDPLKFDLPDITLEYAWREAEGADDRVSAMNATRTISGKASNGTAERPWSMTPPASTSAINAFSAVNEIMGTGGTGTAMAWSAWTPWPGSARARWRQTFEGDASSTADPLPWMKQSFARRDLKVRLLASRSMPVPWKIYLRKTVSSYTVGAPGRQWASQSIFPDPVVLGLAKGDMETSVTLVPPDASTPGGPTQAFPLNQALTEYSLTTADVPAYPGAEDTDGDGLTDATEKLIGTSFTTFSSEGNGLPDNHTRTSGLDAPVVQLVSHTRGLAAYCSNTSGASNTPGGSTTFSRSWTATAPSATSGNVTSYPGFNTKLDFMAFPNTPTTALPDQLPSGELVCSASASQFIPSQVGKAHWARLQHKRVWALLKPVPKEATDRTYIRLLTEKPYSGDAIYTPSIVTFHFIPDHSESTNFEELEPTFTAAHTGTSITISLLPVDFVVPDVRPDQKEAVLARYTGDDPGFYADGGGTGGSGASSVPTPAKNPPTAFTDKGSRATSWLRVAKMEDSLQESDAGVSLEPKFDRDLLQLRILGVPATTPATALSFQLKTTSANGTVLDPDTRINLIRQNIAGGTFLSPPLLLVSDIEDDTAPQVTPSDESINDPTHLAALGGSVIASSIGWTTPQGNLITLNPSSLAAKVPPATKTFPINIYRMADCTLTRAQIDQQIIRLKERYLQIGVAFNPVFAPGDLPVPPEMHAKGTVIGPATPGGEAQETALVKAYGTPENARDINVFFCQLVLGADRNTGGSILLRVYARMGGNVNLINNIFIGSNDFAQLTLAHEVGHLLTGKNHYGGSDPGDYEKGSEKFKTRHNLMSNFDISYVAINSTKRLYEIQQNMILPPAKKP